MNEQTRILETKAAELGGRALEWNELDFVGWKEFRRMAPAVIGLEMARLERLIDDLEPDTGDYNTLVRARYEMRQFADRIERAGKDDREALGDHIGRALLAVSLLRDRSDTLTYIHHRLQYVYDRLKLIY